MTTDKSKKIQQAIIDFRNRRDWEQFHDPKNLAEAISIEAGELLENFLWKTTEESRLIEGVKLDNVKQESADIFIYLLLLCESLNFDLLDEAEKKLTINEGKYPEEKTKGNSRKYNEL